MFNRLKESNSVTPVEEMEGARRATEVSSIDALANAAASSDPEVLERPQRRRFTAKYKLQVLQQADACTEPGEIGVLLRREGLYSSHLSSWRRLRESGALAGLTPHKRGRKTDPAKQQIQRVAELVYQACSNSHETGCHMIDELGKLNSLTVDWEELRDPQNYLGVAQTIIDRALDQ